MNSKLCHTSSTKLFSYFNKMPQNSFSNRLRSFLNQESPFSSIINNLKKSMKNNKIKHMKKNVLYSKKIREFLDESNYFNDNKSMKTKPEYIELKNEINNLTKINNSFNISDNKQDYEMNKKNDFVHKDNQFSNNNDMKVFSDKQIEFLTDNNLSPKANINEIKYNSLYTKLKNNIIQDRADRKYSYSTKLHLKNEAIKKSKKKNINLFSKKPKNKEKIEMSKLDNSSYKAIRTKENNPANNLKCQKNVKIMKFLSKHDSNKLDKSSIINYITSSKYESTYINNTFRANCLYLNNTLSPNNKKCKKDEIKRKKEYSNIYQLINSQSNIINIRKEKRNTDKFISGLNRSSSFSSNKNKFKYENDDKMSNFNGKNYFKKYKKINLNDDNSMIGDDLFKNSIFYRNIWNIKKSKSFF